MLSFLWRKLHDWHTQINIDLFMDDFINNHHMIDGKPQQPSPTDLKDFLNGLGTKDTIINFLCTPYHGHSRKIKAEERGTPFQAIIKNMPANYISVLREIIGAEWQSLVDRHSREGRFAFRLEGPNQTDRLNVLLGGLPETTRKNVVNDLLAYAIEISDASSIPALRQAFLGGEEEVIYSGGGIYESDLRARREDLTAKWAKALIEDRYIFTAISEGASPETINALLKGLNLEQYQDVLMATDPDDMTDPTPLMMQVMLFEDWGVKEAFADRFAESSWENLLTGYWSERFIENIFEAEKAADLLSFMLEYLSDDGILRVAQANDRFLLKAVVGSENFDVYLTLLNHINDQDIQESIFSLIKEIAKSVGNISYYDADSNKMGGTIPVPAFILKDTYNAEAGKAKEVVPPEDLRCTYTCFNLNLG